MLMYDWKIFEDLGCSCWESYIILRVCCSTSLPISARRTSTYKRIHAHTSTYKHSSQFAKRTILERLIVLSHIESSGRPIDETRLDTHGLTYRLLICRSAYHHASLLLNPSDTDIHIHTLTVTHTQGLVLNQGMGSHGVPHVPPRPPPQK